MRGAAAFVYPRRRTTHKYATVGLLTTHDGLAEIDTKSQILVENRDFFLPKLGCPRRNIAIIFGVKKLEWCGYPTLKKYEDMFICFERIHERDRQTDGRTLHECIGRAFCIALRRKNHRSQKSLQVSHSSITKCTIAHE